MILTSDTGVDFMPGALTYPSRNPSTVSQNRSGHWLHQPVPPGGAVISAILVGSIILTFSTVFNYFHSERWLAD